MWVYHKTKWFVFFSEYKTQRFAIQHPEKDVFVLTIGYLYIFHLTNVLGKDFQSRVLTCYYEKFSLEGDVTESNNWHKCDKSIKETHVKIPKKARATSIVKSPRPPEQNRNSHQIKRKAQKNNKRRSQS